MNMRHLAALCVTLAFSAAACKRGDTETTKKPGAETESPTKNSALTPSPDPKKPETLRQVKLKLKGPRTCASACNAVIACIPERMKEKAGFEKRMRTRCEENCEMQIKRGGSLERYLKRAEVMCTMFKRGRRRAPRKDGPPRKVSIGLTPYVKPPVREGKVSVLPKPLPKITLPKPDLFECKAYCTAMWLCVPSQARMATTEEKYDKVCHSGCETIKKDPERVKKALLALKLLCKSSGRL